MNIKNDGYPENLDEAIETLIDFETEIVEMIKADSTDNINKILSFLHHSVGQFIRNSWFLWWKENHNYKEWPKNKPAIVTFFNNINIYHADDMSNIILKSLIYKIKGIDIKLEEEINYYINYWKCNGFPDGIPK